MVIAPIVVFSYNRPDHLQRTLNALSLNQYADQSVLFIYCDGVKESASDEQIKNVEMNRKVAHSFKTSVFKSVTVIEREKNVGLAANIVGAVTEILQQWDRIITLEDDVVASPGFLRYMNDSLELYKNDDEVMHISAYMWPHKCKLPETFFYRVPYPGGGWATWRRAWTFYNDNAQELYDFWNNHWKEFDAFGGDYLSKQLIGNVNGTLKTWFIKWYAVMLQRKALTLYPGRSLTNNIGFDETATNCYTTTKFDVIPIDNVQVRRIKIKENKKASHAIYVFYQGHWYNKGRRRAALARFLKFIGLK